MCAGPVILWKTMAVPGPPLLLLLSLLLPMLLSKASLPAAAYTLTPGRQQQKQHKLLHLGEGKHVQKHTHLQTKLPLFNWDFIVFFFHVWCFSPPRLAQGLWHGSLQTKHGREDCVRERGQTSLLALAGLSAGRSIFVLMWFSI